MRNLIHRVVLAATHVLLSCGCLVTVHGGGTPTWCYDCLKPNTRAS